MKRSERKLKLNAVNFRQRTIGLFPRSLGNMNILREEEKEKKREE